MIAPLVLGQRILANTADVQRDGEAKRGEQCRVSVHEQEAIAAAAAFTNARCARERIERWQRRRLGLVHAEVFVSDKIGVRILQKRERL